MKWNEVFSRSSLGPNVFYSRYWLTDLYVTAMSHSSGHELSLDGTK